jgi:hypothetical protein
MVANRRTRVILLVVILTCTLLVTAWYALSNWLDSSNFGKVAINLNNGTRAYVIHESWGLQSNELSITLNSDGCLPPNPATDYIDTYGDGESLIYSVSGDQLILYDDEGPVSMHEPTTPWSGVKVSVQKTRAWSDMFRNPQEFGVFIVKVPLNEFCWKNFFRKAGTSLRNGRMERTQRAKKNLGAP